MLNLADPRKQLVSRVSPHLHAEQPVDAARIIAEYSGVRAKVETVQQAHDIVFPLLHWCLDNNGYEEAAELLLPKSLFDPNPNSTKLIWKTFENSSNMLLMGAASMSKSYSVGVRLWLEWIRDPEYTNVKVLGPSEQHLEDNLFTHLVTMHRASSLPMPGDVGQLFIGLDPRSRKSAISGVVIPIGKKAAGRLQGAKRVPRKKPHPIFGALTRLFVFLDEIENIPIGVWKDVDNILANKEGLHGLKVIGAFNPRDPTSPVAQRAEPQDGWQSLDIETAETWKSKRGWDVVRLDAYKCENIVQKRIVYPGLQTEEGLAALISNAGGLNTPGWYTMARAWYPPGGTNYSVIPEPVLNKFRGRLLFTDVPKRCAGIDIALEGGDTADMFVGQFGLASGVKYPPTVVNPEGLFAPFKDTLGRNTQRQAIQVNQIFTLPPADSVRMADTIKRMLQSLGVEPEWVMLDRTGNGAGVHDILKDSWSASVRGVNYSESAGTRKIASEDSDTADKVYERAVSELWFAMRKFIEFEYIKLDPEIEYAELKEQLTGRLYEPGKRHKVESKREYKSRGNKSPGKADALSLIIHAARLASGIVIGILPSNAPGEDDTEGGVYFRIGCTDRAVETL